MWFKYLIPYKFLIIIVLLFGEKNKNRRYWGKYIYLEKNMTEQKMNSNM